jgi:hypothetical protein
MKTVDNNYNKEFDSKMSEKLKNEEDFTCEEYKRLVETQPYKEYSIYKTSPVIATVVIGNKIVFLPYIYSKNTIFEGMKPYEVFEKTTVRRNEDGSLCFFSSMEKVY